MSRLTQENGDDELCANQILMTTKARVRVVIVIVEVRKLGRKIAAYISQDTADNIREATTTDHLLPGDISLTDIKADKQANADGHTEKGKKVH